MASPTTAAAIRDALQASLQADDTLVLVGETVDGIAGTRAGLGGSRVYTVPVADRAAVALSVGLALGGRTVVVELTATGRLPAVLEALAEAAAVASAGEFAVPLVVRVPYGTEAGDRVDRPLGDLLAAVPGLAVVCGSSPGQVVGLLQAALGAGKPVVLLEPRSLYDARGPLGGPVPLDRARVVRDGVDVTLAAWGTGVASAIVAADQLDADGISAQVVDLVCLAPLDSATLGRCVVGTGRLVAVHPDDGALAHRVLRVGSNEAFLYLESPPATAEGDPGTIARVARDSVTY